MKLNIWPWSFGGGQMILWPSKFGGANKFNFCHFFWLCGFTTTFFFTNSKNKWCFIWCFMFVIKKLNPKDQRIFFSLNWIKSSEMFRIIKKYVCEQNKSIFNVSLRSYGLRKFNFFEFCEISNKILFFFTMDKKSENG